MQNNSTSAAISAHDQQVEDMILGYQREQADRMARGERFEAYVEIPSYDKDGTRSTRYRRTEVAGKNMGKFWATTEPSQYWVKDGSPRVGPTRRLITPDQDRYLYAMNMAY